MNTRLSPFWAAHLWRASLPPVRQFFFWYGRRLKDMGLFGAGYIVGGIVVAIMIEVPALAYLALARLH